MGSSWRNLSTPIGWIQLETSEGFLTKLDFLGEEPKDKGHSIDDPKDEEILEKTAKQLEQYLLKKIQRFDLPLNPQANDISTKNLENIARNTMRANLDIQGVGGRLW